MDKKKKIGLVLAFKGTNYGALLQAYATQHIIESLGFDTEIIDFRGKKNQISNFFKRGYFQFRIISWLNKRKNRIPSLMTNNDFAKNRKGRREIAEDFRSRTLHNIMLIRDYKYLKNLSLDYQGVIIGSDQKWLPGACYDAISSLDFVSQGTMRISYATSLGVSEYPKYCWHSSKKMWEKMDHLSVREKKGADIIHQICGNINVSVVLDPTYLLTTSAWKELIPEKCMNEKKYLFCYFLGSEVDNKQCARRYADAHNLQLVSLFSNESLGEIDQSYADKLISDATPEDFVNWIRGAECIFTDSFHGLAFSVINQKQFYVFYRKRIDVVQSRNSRIDNILSTWKLEDRLILNQNIDWEKHPHQDIDYKEVERILDAKREESLSFLKEALAF